MNKDFIAAINEIKGPLNTGSLRDRLNPTCDGLAMGLATGLESAQSIVTALTLPGTQTPTPMTPQLSTTPIPQQTAPTATQQQYYLQYIPQQPA